MAAHSKYSCLEIPWTEKPGGLQSMGLQRAGKEHTQQRVAERTQHTVDKEREAVA